MDLESLDKWDDYTDAKEAMFFYTDTADAPWAVVKSNDKKRARLEAMRHVLSRFPYDGKDDSVVGTADPKVGRPPKGLFGARQQNRPPFPEPLTPRAAPRPPAASPPASSRPASS